MDDFSFEDFNFGSGNEDYDFSGLGGGQDFDFSGFDNLDISSLLGDGGMDLSGLDMGPEAFDISSLLGGDQGIDFSQVAGDYGSDLGSELAAALQDTGNASSIFSDDGGIDVEALLNAQQGNNLTFDDDTEPGSSGGNQGSEGQAGFDDFGSYEGSSYSN
jgi:hypothetical protein